MTQSLLHLGPLEVTGTELQRGDPSDIGAGGITEGGLSLRVPRTGGAGTCACDVTVQGCWADELLVMFSGRPEDVRAREHPGTLPTASWLMSAADVQTLKARWQERTWEDDLEYVHHQTGARLPGNRPDTPLPEHGGQTLTDLIRTGQWYEVDHRPDDVLCWPALVLVTDGGVPGGLWERHAAVSRIRTHATVHTAQFLLGPGRQIIGVGVTSTQETL